MAGLIEIGSEPVQHFRVRLDPAKRCITPMTKEPPDASGRVAVVDNEPLRLSAESAAPTLPERHLFHR
mgnify:CR=1 FL=1